MLVGSDRRRQPEQNRKHGAGQAKGKSHEVESSDSQGVLKPRFGVNRSGRLWITARQNFVDDCFGEQRGALLHEIPEQPCAER